MDFGSNSFLSKSTILNFMNVLLLLFSMDLKYVITASVCVCVCVCVGCLWVNHDDVAWLGVKVDQVVPSGCQHTPISSGKPF